MMGVRSARRSWRIACALALFGLSSLCGWAWALTPVELYAKVSPSVWRIRTYDKEGLALSQGSAVVIGPETLITNCHVLRKAARFVVARDNTSLGGTLEMWDTARDVCQVRARNLTAPAVELGDASALVVGQNVYALGSPEGLELTLSAGLVSSLRHDESQHLVAIQTSAPISPGSSGGGLFDDQGRLIGVTTMTIAAANAQNLNFALPVDWIRELPQRHLAAHAQAASQPVMVAAAPVGPSEADRVPFLDGARQKNYQEYLGRPSPKAFAISDNGHCGYAWGTRVKDPSQPTDPKARALALCAAVAGKPCMLYSVDGGVVYRP